MSSPGPTTGTSDPSRWDRKRATILEAAQEAFFANGFVGTSMDQVAAAAAVSKQTVYKHFSNKETLFREVVTDIVRAGDGGISPDQFTIGDGSLEERLGSFAREFLKGVMQPEVLQLRRLVTAEAARFPELGLSFYELGPKRAAKQVAAALRDAAGQQGTTLEDPGLAAEHLLSLVLSIPLNQAMLLGSHVSITDAALDRYADEGVAVFLRAYGLDSS
jgi:TetR/AcrR family transcriptional regulator, mexJK operon transcriptional repressor